MDRNTEPKTLTKNTLAKALYDNKAECPDELAFRRGDILTVLEQNLLDSEGWWKCSLHGKQGLAPANRLQLLISSQSPSVQQDYQGQPTNSQAVYQDLSAHKTLVSLSVYEKMDGWIKHPPCSSASSSPTQGVYEVPAYAAKLLSEKAQSSSSQQHLYTLPRATWASALKNTSIIYDVPSSRACVSSVTQGLATPPSSRKGPKLRPATECRLGKAQQLYDIPLSSEKARTRTRQESSVDNVYDIPPTTLREPSISTETANQGKHLNHYNTMPNLRKSEWIYDVPVSPEKAGLKQSPRNHSSNKHMFYDVPPRRFDSGMQNIPPITTEGKSVILQAYDVPPVQRKLTAPELPLYDVPSTHDVLSLHQNGNYDVPQAVLSSRIEKEDHQTLYDIPKGMSVPSLQKEGTEKHSHNSGDTFPQCLIKDGKLDHSRLSVSSVDSRTSMISTSSSSSMESSCSASSSSSSSSISSSSGPLPSEEPTKKTTMELDLAIGTLTKLQHSVSSSIASLMIFVSSKWRYQEYLKGNIEEIHRAVDHIESSLADFLSFARTIEGNATWLSDCKLQARIKKQLNILTDSFQMLVETREALNNCKWSLEVLVIKKPPNNPDDLDRFVMVARTIPDDIKRFVSIIIANGKLLFRNSCKEKEHGKEQKIGEEHKMTTHNFEQRIEDDDLPSNIVEKPKNNIHMEKSRVGLTENSDFVPIQRSSPTIKYKRPSKLDGAKKLVISDLCRLYFGSVQKAIDTFHQSLSTDQSPEAFIAQSKLIIMIGQKLVDALCQETLEKAHRNDILCGSSQFCSLLKNLAVATKNAATRYPNSEAMRELRDQAEGLSKYTQQFRVMIE
ncbi:cas scaffolding protein family member 4 [Tiliqua scincoides]|uniref:cas scaffolding protein family member 4 n=1 Tax=Tiliqua scincoides TaxID=71010 RepID=UPI003462EE78